MYPMKKDSDLKAKSPYVFNLSQALRENFTIINYGIPSAGVFEFIKFFFKTDIYYFNWIENDSRKFKYIFFSIFFSVAKLLGKKIVWTHHNIHPHKTNNSASARFIHLLSNKADYLIFHTTESFKILGMEKSNPRCLYFFHPFFTTQVALKKNTGYKNTLLIWGNVRKSKGVHQFLDYLKSVKKLYTFSINIIGKFESEQYYHEIKNEFANSSVNINNKYIDSEQLQNLHDEAKYVFFPYTGSSVLNSGALVTSLPKGTAIIGPNTGAFKQLGEEGLITTYNNFDEIINILNTDDIPYYPVDRVDSFIKKHTWSNFSDFLNNSIA